MPSPWKLFAFATAALTAAEPPTLYLSGLEKAGQQEWGASRQAIEETILRQPRFGPAYRRLGQIATAARAEKPTRDFFETLTRRPETAAGGYLGLGWLAFDRRDWPEALRLSELAVQAGPPDFTAPYLLWNRASARQGKGEFAEGYYRAWIKREPAATLPRFALSHLQSWMQKSSAAALEQMRQLHSGDRDFLEAWLVSEYQAGERKRSLIAVQEVSTLAREWRDPELEFLASYYAVGILSDLGLRREAAITAERSEPEARRLGETNRGVYLAYQACRLRLDLGEPVAEALCRAAVERATGTPGNESLAADALASLAEIEQSRGQFATAVKHLEKAADLASQSGFALAEAFRRRDLAALLLDLGQPDVADALLRQVLTMARGASAAPQAEALTLATMARAAALRGQVVEAEAHFQAALALAGKMGDKETARIAWTEKALGSVATGNLREAGRALDEAIQRATASGQRPVLVSLLAAAGHTKTRLRQWPEAIRNFEEALRLAEETGRRDAEWEAFFGLGVAAEQRGQIEEALKHYQAAITSSEDLRSRIPDVAWRGPYFASRQELYHRAAGLMVGLGRLPEAFSLLERSRARALLDRRSDGVQSAVADNAGRDLAKQLSLAERRLMEATLSPGGNRELVRLRRDADAAAAAYAVHASRLRRTDTPGREATPLEAIQPKLPPDTALLTYSTGPARGFLLVTTRDRVRAYPIASAPALKTRTAELVDLLKRPPERLTTARLNRLLHQFYLDLVAPAEADLRARRRWLIAADGPIQQIPFAALLERPVSDDGVGHHLIRRVSITQIPSASFWLHLQAPRPQWPAGAIVTMADASNPVGPSSIRSTSLGSLPGARREVQLISALYAQDKAQRIEVRVGAQATEREAVGLLSGARLAHLAVHGYSDPSRPQASALLLSPGAGLNGLLQAYEIQELVLPKLELVVLSSCDTLIGKDLPGEGVQALATSFLLAGAKSVVGSLWPAGDSAAAGLMVNFHTELRRGKPVSQALRVAQLIALQDPARAHTYYWAGFQAIGAGE